MFLKILIIFILTLITTGFGYWCAIVYRAKIKMTQSVQILSPAKFRKTSNHLESNVPLKVDGKIKLHTNTKIKGEL